MICVNLTAWMQISVRLSNMFLWKCFPTGLSLCLIKSLQITTAAKAATLSVCLNKVLTSLLDPFQGTLSSFDKNADPVMMKNSFEYAWGTFNLSCQTLRTPKTEQIPWKLKKIQCAFYSPSLSPLNIHPNSALPCLVDTTVYLSWGHKGSLLLVIFVYVWMNSSVVCPGSFQSNRKLNK